MLMTMLEALGLPLPVALGLLSAALSVLAYVPYMRDTLRDVTQPHRASWFIWSVLSGIAFFSLLYEGAGMTLYFAGAQAGCTTLIFLLSLSHGQGRWITRTDGLVLCVAAAGLVAWALTDSALYALGLSITISLLGGTLTVLKAYHAPQSETWVTWALSGVAAGVALLAVGTWNPVALAYPLYLFVLNGAILAALGLGVLQLHPRRGADPARGPLRRSAAYALVWHVDPRLPQPVRVPSKGLVPRARPPFPPQRVLRRRSIVA